MKTSKQRTISIINIKHHSWEVGWEETGLKLRFEPLTNLCSIHLLKMCNTRLAKVLHGSSGGAGEVHTSGGRNCDQDNC